MTFLKLTILDRLRASGGYLTHLVPQDDDGFVGAALCGFEPSVGRGRQGGTRGTWVDRGGIRPCEKCRAKAAKLSETTGRTTDGTA